MNNVNAGSLSNSKCMLTVL